MWTGCSEPRGSPGSEELVLVVSSASASFCRSFGLFQRDGLWSSIRGFHERVVGVHRVVSYLLAFSYYFVCLTAAFYD